MERTRRRAALAAVLVLAAVAAACGSSTPSGASDGATHLSPAAIGRDQVAQMVLADGDLAGYRLQSTAAESLQDQMPPAKMAGAALARRLVHQSWIASEHSVLVATGTNVVVLSDANLFRGAAVARRIWTIELHKVPGTITRVLKVPAGAPPGARFVYQHSGSHAGFEIGWRQGPVIGLAIVLVSPKAKVTQRLRTQAGALLATAARTQSHRIAAVENGTQAA
jgi:hypothetical protein